MYVEDDRLLTTQEVAERLRISQDGLRRILRDGRLPAIKIGRHHGRYRIRESDLAGFLRRTYR